MFSTFGYEIFVQVLYYFGDVIVYLN